MYVELSNRGGLERRVNMTTRKTIIIAIALFLGVDALAAMAKVGFPIDLARIVGAVVLASIALYIGCAPPCSRRRCACSRSMWGR
jgi:hypothetical protein